ncbi:MAG: HNH endonuclease [Synergistaceae bacterium]|nr:HNH endonuclease [Synergistaceae bacterium]
MGAPLTIYVCEGEPSEIQERSETIDIAGVPLSKQELRNASYHGPFVTKARAVFSNTGNANMARWKTYVRGDPKRQAVLEAALDWASDGKIDEHMATHRHDEGIDELTRHFETVIGWIGSVFDYTGKEICGLDWGRLYREHHGKAYDRAKVGARVEELLADPQVTDERGIFEYILDGERDASLLNVRAFDDVTKRAVYAAQTKAATEAGTSNCPLCVIGHDGDAKRIWDLKDMDADHVTAWSRGGATDAPNCQMLCKTHNRAKRNR